MPWQDTYVELGVQFDATLSDEPNDLKHLKSALLAIIDITNDDSTDTGTLASTFLLGQMDLLYRQAKQHYSYDSWRDKMVKSINDFTIKHFGDLTSFVNSLPWPDACAPYYWAELSEKGHVDTSGWNVCS